MIDTLHWPSGHTGWYKSLQAVCTYKNAKQTSQVIKTNQQHVMTQITSKELMTKDIHHKMFSNSQTTLMIQYVCF